MPKPSLKTLLKQDEIIVAPGIYDALSALLAEQAGFKTVFLSGSAVAYSQIGMPDIGLITMSEMADTCARVTDRVDIPVVVDADSGFGNAAHAERTVRMLEKAGASAVQIEDQLPIKSERALKGRPLISTDAMVEKIKHAVNARRSAETLISARTDAPASQPLPDTIERVERYCDAGADIVFAEGLTNSSDVAKVVQAAGETPVIYNLLFQKGDLSSASQLEALGVSLALFPGDAILSSSLALKTAFDALKQDPSLPIKGAAMKPADLNGALGTDAIQKRFAEYPS